MSLTEDQIKLLQEPLVKEDVKQRDGTGNTKLSYLASYHVIAEANRIFGFDGWDSEILSLTQVDKTEYEKPAYKAGDAPKQMVSISYLCKLRVTIKAGDSTTIREDVGFGNGVAGNNAYGLGSCIELASKEAVTDALKRCMRYYGSKFGLTLYDKDDIQLYSDDYELTKTVTEEQLADLRSLYEERGIDDEWVITALKGEGHEVSDLSTLRTDWYNLVFEIARKYKLKEIETENYKTDIENVIKLMKESANMNMLKALFKEAWNKTTEQNDKEKQMECQNLYESLKEGFEK